MSCSSRCSRVSFVSESVLSRCSVLRSVCVGVCVCVGVLCRCLCSSSVFVFCV